jgi:hypothetical protein
VPDPAPSLEIGLEVGTAPRQPRKPNDGYDIQFLTRTSLKETEAQIQNARLQCERNKTLFNSGVIGKDQYESALGQLRVLVGRLEGWDEELVEESERMKIEGAKKEAELSYAHAQEEVARSVVARNSRLNERKPGMVAAEEVNKNEAELRRSSAALMLKRAEAQEVGLKMTQLRHRRELIRRAIEEALKTTPDIVGSRLALPLQPTAPGSSAQ